MAESPEQERNRLSELYARMSEGAIRELAADAVDLTDIARQVLAEEIGKRGLDIRLLESMAVRSFESRDMVTVRQFRDLPEALLAKGMLDSAGIQCLLVDENMIRMDWFLSNLLGGIKLQVNRDDVEEAVTFLIEPIPESFDIEGLGKYRQPQCPHCGSFDIAHHAGLDKRFALPALCLAGIPIPIARNEWKCQSCDAKWLDSQSQKAEPESPK
jgi:Putative prokaryotic signal transducing protein